MDHLDDITLAELHRALDAVEGKKPAQRLLAAIAYKEGISQTELAEWHGVQRRTIYSWLRRFDGKEPLARAATDDPRPGRPRKLTADQREAVHETLEEPPDTAAPGWTPALLKAHLEQVHGVSYSIPSCRRLLREAGLQYRRSRETATPSSTERRGVWLPKERASADGQSE